MARSVWQTAAQLATRSGTMQGAPNPCWWSYPEAASSSPTTPLASPLAVARASAFAGTVACGAPVGVGPGAFLRPCYPDLARGLAQVVATAIDPGPGLGSAAPGTLAEILHRLPELGHGALGVAS
jgi:hypothetical protein